MRKITWGLATLLVVSAGCEGNPTDALAQELLQPACASPAPLLGTFDARAPGYIVQLVSDVEVVPTVELLAAKYDFEAGAIWEHALRGFFAVVPDETVRGLRCETAVKVIEHNGVTTLGLR